MPQYRLITDKAKQKAIDDIVNKSAEGDKSKPLPEPVDTSIDDLLKRSLRAVYGLMRAIEHDIASGAPTRETVQNLKDATTMLWEYKKKEQEFLENLSDEELEKLSSK